MKNLKIGTKLIVIGVGMSAVLGLILVGLNLWQSTKTESIAEEEVKKLVLQQKESIVDGVVAMVTSQQELLEQKISADLNVARSLLKQAGEVRFVERTTNWQAINQFSRTVNSVELPRMYAGDIWLGQNYDLSVKSPVVDDVKEMISSTSTIFQRMNDNGDMLRVSTNVATLDNKRAVGTYIPAINPDGTPNGVLKKVLNGERFIGRAFVVNRWYVTAYEPIRESNKVVGMLYVGVPEESAVSLRRQIMDISVGETGYVFVLDPQGKYIISEKGRRDGESLWDQKDASGNAVFQDMIKQAMSLKSDEYKEFKYQWKDEGSQSFRERTVVLTYYEPWQWVIGVGSWSEEFTRGVQKINHANKFSRNLLLIVLVVVLAGACVVWVFISRSIVGPVQQVVSLLKDASGGDLTKRLKVNTKDEIGEMSVYFNQFVEKLESSIGKIGSSAGTLSTSAMDLSSVSTQTAQSVRTLSERTSLIAAASEETSANTDSVAGGMDQATNSLSSVAGATEEMSATVSEIAGNTEKARRISEQAMQHRHKESPVPCRHWVPLPRRLTGSPKLSPRFPPRPICWH